MFVHFLILEISLKLQLSLENQIRQPRSNYCCEKLPKIFWFTRYWQVRRGDHVRDEETAMWKHRFERKRPTSPTKKVLYLMGQMAKK